MKAKAKPIEECTTLFEIEVSRQDVTKAFDEVYDEITKVAEIPGFRVGKAPKELVKKHYAKSAKDEVLKRLIPDAYRSTLAEHKISPVGLPEISEVDFGEEGLSFKAKVDTRPTFKLKDYKGIKLEKKNAVVKDEEAEKVLQDMREMNAKYIAVEDRPLQMGDYAVSDLECFVDGKPIHKKRENLWVYMDKDSVVSGLPEKMAGMNAGEKREIEIAFPGEYQDKNLAGKPARYSVSLKEIKLRQLPDVDGEFAKDLGKESVDDLKKEISKELETRAKANADIDVENQLLNRLADDNTFKVPSSFIARQLNLMVEDAKRRLGQKGFKKEDLDKKDAEFRERFKIDAERQVKLLFILGEIADKENIAVSDEDMKVAYGSIAAQTGKSEEAVRSYYEKEGLIDNLREKLREGKTIQFLIEKADIVERS